MKSYKRINTFIWKHQNIYPILNRHQHNQIILAIDGICLNRNFSNSCIHKKSLKGHSHCVGGIITSH